MALSITITARKIFTRLEEITNAKLNALGLPTLALSGTADTSQITNSAVTAVKGAYGPWFYATDSGTANAHVLAAAASATILPTSLVAGQEFAYVAANTNTAAVTVAVSGIAGTKALTKQGANALSAGDIRTGQLVWVRYDGTQFQMVQPSGNGAVVFGADSGSTDSYAITPTPAVRAYADLTGVPVIFKANTVNTGAATLQVSGLASPPTIVKSYNGTLDNGDIKAGQWVCVTFDGTNFQLLSPVTPSSARATVSVRQTALTGPVDTNGHPVILSYSGQNISLLATSTSPLVVAFAAGHDANGAVDYIARYTANTSSAWTLPASDNTYYLFVDRDASTAALTYGYTTTRPTYVNDDAASIASGAHTFLINEMQMYLGDGATATTKQRVFVGESVVSGGAITSITSYMFRGQFKSSADQSFTLANSSKSETHKLGLKPDIFRWTLVNQTGSDGYAQNDEVLLPQSHNANGVFSEASSNATTCTLRYMFGTYAPYVLNATPALDLIAAADWKLRCYAYRGW